MTCLLVMLVHEDVSSLKSRMLSIVNKQIKLGNIFAKAVPGPPFITPWLRGMASLHCDYSA
jgi:hypothetical protein